MSIFAVERLEAVRDNGRVLFFKLVKDDVCWFDEFYKEVSKNSKRASELRSILSMMDYLAETNAMLPDTKFNSVKHGNKVMGYEFKKNDLRVYCMKPSANVVVVFGGYKKNQKNDIKKLKSIVEEVEDVLENLIRIKMKSL